MAWGDNAHGQLGNGSTNNSPVPMVASGLGGVTAVSAGGEHSLAYAPPPPTVTSISPSAGTTAGGTSVTIKGTGFLSGATVEIGNPATSVNVVSETEITATTAATAAGSDEVVVTDAGGISTGTPSPSYTYVIPPTATSISPSAGTTAGGRLVTIKGTGFLSGATVKIGNPATSVNVVSETEITAMTAATAAGSDEVVVTDTKGTSTGGPSYTYVTYGVTAWGDNAHGQLGNNSTTDNHVPVVVSGLGGVTTVSAGGEHSLARLSDATVKAWGDNQFGQLGNNSTTDSHVPVVVNVSGVTEVSAGGEHSLARLSNGTVMAWGDNAHGQLGNGSTNNSPVPVVVSGLGGKTVTEVSAGGEHSLALLSNGTVVAWGDNAHGQLGNNSTNNSAVPVAVSGLGGVTAVAAGGEHSLALLSNGTVVAWGDNAHGQLGNGSTTDNHVPVVVSGLGGVTAVAAGGEHSLALLSNATVMAWGDNAHGQLGNNSTTDNHVPVEVSGLGGKTVTEVAAGGEHSLALLSNATVMAWGDNAHGQLGNGSTTDNHVPVAVSGLGGVTAVSAGGEHSLAYAPPPPTVTSISPSAGTTAGGTSVTIKGTGFLSGATVEIGNPATSVNVVSETEITATTAATAAGSDEVVVTDAGGISTGTPSPSYTYVIPPTVTSISPSAGTTAGGTSVTIKGTGFLSGATVEIGNPATSVNVVSETEITATTAATAAGSDEVVVTDTKGTSTGGPSYTYVIPPTVTSISPSAGTTAGGTR